MSFLSSVRAWKAVKPAPTLSPGPGGPVIRPSKRPALRPVLLMLLALAGADGSARGAEAADNSSVPKKPFFLPQNPVAAAYVLGRLSNRELIEAPRSEFVYVALLQRPGLDRKFRVEALDGLAKLRKTDAVTELLGGLGALDKKGEDATPVVRDLGGLLLQRKADDLKAKREELAKHSSEAQLALTRQIAYAALITADGSATLEWQKAESESARLADLLGALPLIRDPKLRVELYPKMELLLQKSDRPDVQRAAIAAVSSVPGFESEVFKKLAALAQAGTEPAAVLASLQRVPKKAWPKVQAEALLESAIKYLQSVPAPERTETGFINAMQFATDLASLLPAEKAKAVHKVLGGLGVKIIVLRTVYEQMLYDKRLIVVEAGKPVEFVFQNDDVMPHNLVIGAPGALEEIGLAAEKMPPEPDARGLTYVPDSPKVLQATKLLQLGEKAKLSFTAPTEPGDYCYVCTFPGHWRRMFGTLAVVNDVEAYLASHPEPAEPQVTEWKVEDLMPELDKVGSGRNIEGGRQLFTALACVQCHKLGAVGYAFGPELTDVFQRWKGDRAGVLREILEPSKVINDRYRNYSFELKDGESVSGLIVKEDPTSVTIHAGPSDALVQTLPNTNIASRQIQQSSVMPVGLLNQLTKEQILDLLAFLESGGKADAAEHKH